MDGGTGRPARLIKRFVSPADGANRNRTTPRGTYVRAVPARCRPRDPVHRGRELPGFRRPGILTGLRIQIPNPFELNRGLQDMAEQRGFGYLRDEVDADDGFGKLASKGDEPATLGLSKQEYYLSRA